MGPFFIWLSVTVAMVTLVYLWGEYSLRRSWRSFLRHQKAKESWAKLINGENS